MNARWPRTLILTPDGDHRHGVDRLRDAIAGRALVFEGTPQTPPKVVKDVEVIVTWNGGNPRLLFELYGEIPSALRWIHHSGVGVDQFLTPELMTSKVVVTNLRGLDVYSGAIAEFVMALVLGYSANLLEIEANRRERRWSRFEHELIHGSTMGIIGLGSIGQAVAARAQALGMYVTGTRRHADRKIPGVEVLPPEDLERVIRKSDYLVLAAPRTAVTHGIMDRTSIGWMRPQSVLINVARGGLVDAGALEDALAAGRIRGAALDVFETEPLPADSVLWDVPRLFISPHISGTISGSDAKEAAAFAENLDRYTTGTELLRVVDKVNGY